MQAHLGLSIREATYIVGFCLHEVDDYVDQQEFLGFGDGVVELEPHERQQELRKALLDNLQTDLELKYYLLFTSA